jgi:hypothetical protein
MDINENGLFAINEEYKPNAIENFGRSFERIYADLWQIRTDHPDVGLQTHKTAEGTAIHIINYGYNKKNDAVDPIKELNISLRGEYTDPAVEIHALGGKEILYSVKTEKTY